MSRFGRTWQLTNPKAVMFSRGGETDPEAERLMTALRGLFPIYPLTKGVDTWDLQRLVAFALELVDDLPEVVPEPVRQRRHVPDGRTALTWVHTPKDRHEVSTGSGTPPRRGVGDPARARPAAGRGAPGAQARTGGGLLAAFDARGCRSRSPRARARRSGRPSRPSWPAPGR
ncbi:MAG: hypothetical protein R2734_12655 [Nocardioides sp.]